MITREDLDFIMPFVNGTVETLKVQAQFPVKAGKPYLCKPGEHLKGEISIISTIGMVSSKFKGTMSLSFPEKAFLKIMSNMLMEDYKEIKPELEDGAGELLNIAFGQGKKVLYEKGIGVDKAIPTVVRGDHLKLKNFSDSPTVVIPFESDSGLLYVQIVKDEAK